MEYVLKKDILRKLINEKKTGGVEHKRKNVKEILPFSSSTKTKIIKENFQQVIGEFTRLISSVELDHESNEEELALSENPIVNRITDVIESENDDIKYDFSRFLNHFLFKNNREIKPIHPYFFNFIPLSDGKNQKEEIKVAQFMREVLIIDNNILKDVFNNDGGQDILTNLILENLKPLKRIAQKDSDYQTLMNVISSLYHEDLLFLSNHRDYFLQSFALLTHFYYFLYVYQLILKFDRFENGDYSKIDPLYYALDWEQLNKRRKTTEDLTGFKFVKEKESDLFVHIHTLSQLSHNSFNNEDDDKKTIMTYPEINHFLTEIGEEAISSFLNSVKEWIHEYTSRAGIIFPIDQITSLHDGFKGLFSCLKQGMSSSVCINYGKKIEDAAGSIFLKLRGNLGLTFNITHEFLLLLTSVCVKNKRMPLNKLFEEYEKRGILFDRYSKKEIVQLFDQLNIIEKKSDSGDAQYVKPIL